MELYKRIRKRREELGMSQEDLAKKMGYKSRSSINKIEMGENDIPQSKIATFAKVLLVSEAWLMGYDDQIKKEDPNIIERDSILEEIDEILRRNGWSLSCESYDDDYFIIKNINGATIIGLYDYELLSRYISLKRKGKITADLLVSSESVFFKYLESLGYFIDYDVLNKPYIIHKFGSITIEQELLNDIRSKIDTYSKTTIDSVILKLHEEDFRKERKEKEQISQNMLNAAHARTDIETTPEDQAHDDAIMNDNSEWE